MLHRSNSESKRPVSIAGGSCVLEQLPSLSTFQSPTNRLLATAYDADWTLKTVIPKDAIPKTSSRIDTSAMAINGSCNVSPSLRQQTKKRQTFAIAKVSGVADPNRKFKAALVCPEEPRGLTRRSSWTSAVRQTSEPMDRRASVSTRSLPTFELVRGPRSHNQRYSTLSTLSTGSEGANKPKEEVRIESPTCMQDERDEKTFNAWADEMAVPLHLAEDALDTFLKFVTTRPPRQCRMTKSQILLGKPFDAGSDLGSMDTQSFGDACLQIAGVDNFSSLPDGFLEKAMDAADKDGSGDIDFGEFLYFYYKFSFSEEVLINPAERQLRQAARENNLRYDEIGKYKRAFDDTDSSKNGRIEYEEFKILVTKMLKVPKGQQIPERRIKEMWQEAMRKSHGKALDFTTFVGWYQKYFRSEGMYAGESPFEAYYHNIRRVSVYDGARA